MTEPKVNILLVDDDEVDRLAIKRLLARGERDYGLREAVDINAAIELLKSERFDCMLADYNLGPQTAFELLSQMEAQVEDSPSVVLLTGMGSEQIAVEALKHGVCDYVSKDGLTIAALDAAIDHANDNTNRRRELESEHRTLELMSLYDHLTGLPNRSLFLDRLGNLIEASKRNISKFAVLMIDLDGFKQLNDMYGHQVGDEVLREVGKRMQKTARDSDTFARMGGDEFTALLPGTESIDNVITIAAKIGTAINDPILHQGEALKHGVSIGISMYPRHGCDANTLLHNADKAMYQAKKTGVDFCVYDPGGQISGDRETQIADSLPGIGTDSDLLLCFQPKVSLESGELSGAEVLIRWQHPELGLLPPMEFIPAAERLSMIRMLTYSVVEHTARQIARWREQGFEIPLAINLSPMIVEDHDLPVRLLEVLDPHQVKPGMLILEITETSLISDPRRARKQLEALVNEGFRVSIDDFGTGYSSMQYLRDFPFQEIKIDQTFVRQVTSEWRDESIISAILKLASGFNAECVAEGIEDSQTWDYLQGLGCHYGQGYAISKPLAAKEFLAWRELWQNDLASKRVANSG